jgi:uncharacterized cofD-like protein
VAIRPARPETPVEVVTAIEAADQVVLGPGSLFTSVLAAAIVPDVLAALRRCGGPKIYVCNLRPQHPETDGFTAPDHAAALTAHGVPIDVMVCHPGSLRCPVGAVEVEPAVRCIERKVADDAGEAHDPARLAVVLAELL